jgi:hypothetical protein
MCGGAVVNGDNQNHFSEHGNMYLLVRVQVMYSLVQNCLFVVDFRRLRALLNLTVLQGGFYADVKKVAAVQFHVLRNMKYIGVAR